MSPHSVPRAGCQQRLQVLPPGRGSRHVPRPPSPISRLCHHHLLRHGHFATLTVMAVRMTWDVWRWVMPCKPSRHSGPPPAFVGVGAACVSVSEGGARRCAQLGRLEGRRWLRWSPRQVAAIAQGARSAGVRIRIARWRDDVPRSHCLIRGRSSLFPRAPSPDIGRRCG